MSTTLGPRMTKLNCPLEELCAGKAGRALVFGDGFTHERRPDQRKGWFVYAKKRSGVPDELTIHDLRFTTH